jgi:hypothetical protein
MTEAPTATTLPNESQESTTEPTDEPKSTRIPTPTVRATRTVEPVHEELLGSNEFNGSQVSLPQEPAGRNELYIAHGDVRGDGGCALMVWDSGKTVSGLSQATWKLWRISGGTHDQRMAVVKRKQREVGNCPIVNQQS